MDTGTERKLILGLDMPKRKSKGSKKYDVNGKDDYRAIPVAPGKRAACAPILNGVSAQIDAQLAAEHKKQEGLQELYDMNAEINRQLRGF